jgi:LytS/YehU family sensor histidine kinase
VQKSDLTEEVIYKLSQMMHFTIYDGRKHTVSIADEVAYLQNFIELHQIRYEHHVDIQFKQDIVDTKQRIPPLLFINLLENAFKHGVETQSHGEYIHCKLTTNKQQILFEIENNFDPQVKHKKGDGIGIENLSRRLELLFPNKHQFSRESRGGIYQSTVKIDLV